MKKLNFFMVSSVLIERRALNILGTVVDNPGFLGEAA